MSIEQLTLFTLLALLAEFLGTVGGFGSSLFFVPLAAYFLDFHSVLGVTALFHVLSNINKIIFFRKGFDKNLAIKLGIPAVAAVILGAWLSRYSSSLLLEKALAIFMIVVSLVFLIWKNLVIKPNTPNTIGGGIISGFMAGIVGTGGAVRGLVLSAYGLTAEVFIATSAIIDLGIDLSRSVVYAINGFVHKDDLYLIPLLFVASIAGTWLGKKLLKKIPEEKFKKLVLIMIIGIGLYTLILGGK